jgi:hypothetical protein
LRPLRLFLSALRARKKMFFFRWNDANFKALIVADWVGGEGIGFAYISGSY